MGIDFKQKYGPKFSGLVKSPFDKRDYKFKDLIPVGAIQLPANYESTLPKFRYEQGSTATCCACAYNTIRFMQEQANEDDPIAEPFSVTFTYANRDESENFEGMFMRSCCKKGREGGIPYSQLPGFHNYRKSRNLYLADKEKYLEMAKPFAISSFYTCTSREQIQAAIMACQGVILGIYVFECFYEPIMPTGLVDYNPARDTKDDGGHAVACVGWKTIQGKVWWKVVNSWGASYGVKGCCYIPEDYPWVEPAAYAFVDKVTEVQWTNYKEQWLKKKKS